MATLTSHQWEPVALYEPYGHPLKEVAAEPAGAWRKTVELERAHTQRQDIIVI